MVIRKEEKKHISSKIAYETAGVTKNNNMSSLPKFKPGVAYFYPLLKIHKLRKEDLIPGVDPPAWLVILWREGLAIWSDAFLTEQFLKALEKYSLKNFLQVRLMPYDG